jgi:hypothetical protein
MLFCVQLLIISLMIVVYTILMSDGVRNWVFIIAILAGLARLVPYLGPTVTWTVTIIVTLVQGDNYFGLTPVLYTALVVAAALVVDQIFDNIVSPLIFGQALRIHPALLSVRWRQRGCLVLSACFGAGHCHIETVGFLHCRKMPDLIPAELDAAPADWHRKRQGTAATNVSHWETSALIVRDWENIRTRLA